MRKSEIRRTKSTDSIIEKIEAFRRLDRQCGELRMRFAFYIYLNAVFSFCEDLQSAGRLKSTARKVENLYGLRFHGNHAIQVIIAASSQANVRTRSRWSRALISAFERRREWRGSRSLVEFFHREGGLARCAYKNARHRFHRERKSEMGDWA